MSLQTWRLAWAGLGGCALVALAFAVQAQVLPSAQAEPIWHCSRVPETVGLSDDEEDSQSFQLASMGSEMRAIGITLTDLIDVYEGKPVLLNGRRLNACFMPAETPLTVKALTSLGLNAASMQLQARKSAIVQSHLHMVTDEPAMQTCMAKNFPAVGYLSREAQTDRFLPCF